MPLRLLKLFLVFATFAWCAMILHASDSISYEAVSVKAPFEMPAIQVPVFPNREFVVTNFGAVAGGNISEIIRKAIASSLVSRPPSPVSSPQGEDIALHGF